MAGAKAKREMRARERKGRRTVEIERERVGSNYPVPPCLLNYFVCI